MSWNWHQIKSTLKTRTDMTSHNTTRALPFINCFFLTHWNPIPTLLHLHSQIHFSDNTILIFPHFANSITLSFLSFLFPDSICKYSFLSIISILFFYFFSYYSQICDFFNSRFKISWCPSFLIGNCKICVCFYFGSWCWHWIAFGGLSYDAHFVLGWHVWNLNLKFMFLCVWVLEVGIEN